MKIRATTYVTLPVGTLIEQYTDDRPRVGEVFKIHHIDTKKVVHEAKVTGFDSLPQNRYLVRAVIVK